MAPIPTTHSHDHPPQQTAPTPISPSWKRKEETGRCPPTPLAWLPPAAKKRAALSCGHEDPTSRVAWVSWSCVGLAVAGAERALLSPLLPPLFCHAAASAMLLIVRYMPEQLADLPGLFSLPGDPPPLTPLSFSSSSPLPLLPSSSSSLLLLLLISPSAALVQSASRFFNSSLGYRSQYFVDRNTQFLLVSPFRAGVPT